MWIPWRSPRITWQDVQQMPDDGNRYEAIEGELYMIPAFTVRHQRMSGRVEWALKELLVEVGLGELLHAPVGLEFPTTGEGVQPDILFVSHARRGILAEDWLRGAPVLAVEILSPSTAHRDRGVKLMLYERQGVAEYWIVDPDAEAIEVWRFAGEGRIDLAEIFRRE